jgi:rhomboid protease GluP
MKPTLLQQIKMFKLTFTLIGVNLIAYGISAFMSGSLIDMDLEVLVKLGALFGPITVVHGHWTDLFTAMFLHGGMTHLLMNMFSLYLIGRGVEQYFNTISYLSLYLFSGLIGGLVSLYMHPASVGIGASGAIFGLFGALAGFFLAHRSQIEAHTKAFMKDFAMILGINLVLGFAVESIDVSAHIGGLIVGMIGGFVISKNPKWVWGYSMAMLLVMLVIMQYLPTQYAQRLF